MLVVPGYSTALADGTVAAPALSFLGDTDSGFYRIGANNIGMALGGLKVWDYAAGASGVYYAAADAVAYELAGYKTRGTLASPTVITSGDDLLRIAGYGYSGAAGYVKAAEILFDSIGTIATTRVAGRIVFRTGTDAAPTSLTDALIINETQRVFVPLGTNALPSYSFHSGGTTDPDTGMWSPAANTIAWSTAGVDRGRIDATGQWLLGPNTIWSNAANGVTVKAIITATLAKSGAATFHAAIVDTTAMAQGVGGGMVFIGERQTDVGSVFGGLDGYKENGTSGNEAGSLRLFSGAGGSPQEAMRLHSTKVVFLGKTQIGGTMGTLATDNQIHTATQGSASTTMYIGNASIDVTSDMRVKSNIEEYTKDALALMHHLDVVEYDMVDGNKPFGGIYDDRYVGLTAQNLYQVAPWAVNTQGGKHCAACLSGRPCNEHRPWQVKQDLLAGIFVKGFQQADERLSIVEAENSRLRNRLALAGIA